MVKDLSFDVHYEAKKHYCCKSCVCYRDYQESHAYLTIIQLKLK